MTRPLTYREIKRRIDNDRRSELLEKRRAVGLTWDEQIELERLVLQRELDRLQREAEEWAADVPREEQP